MEEDYVSFETAKLLKENGFDETTYRNYSATGDDSYYNFTSPEDGIPCPTIQMARKWLMEKKGYYIVCMPTLVDEKFFVELYKFQFGEWNPVDDEDTDMVYPGGKNSLFYKDFDKPEIAYDDAMQFCLKKSKK